MPTSMPPLRVWRVVAAFAIAPFAAALLYAMIYPGFAGIDNLDERILRTSIVNVLVGGYPSAMALGLPAFFVLYGRVRPNPQNCALTGSVADSLPWISLVVFHNPDWAFDHGHVTVEHNSKTFWGWLYAAEDIGELVTLGALGGTVFWLIAFAGAVRTADTTPAPKL